MTIRDTWGRRIRYLRISVTDRCNLRCRYCMPPGGIRLKRHDEILAYEEIARAVAAVVPAGITRIRLTGGEPLVRPNLPVLMRMLTQIEGLEDISLTSNGQLLAQYAQELYEAGLRRINVSLDSLRPDRYRDITGGGELAHVWEGLETCQALGFRPIKINTVLVRGMNEDEVVDFARLSLDRPYDVRFIEFMPMGEIGLWSPTAVVSEQESRARIASLGPLEVAPTPATSRGGTAWRLRGAQGTVTFISPLSHPFCETCNRLRLTSDGQLRPCLLADQFVDLRGLLRAGCRDEDIRAAFTQAAGLKPARHHLQEGNPCGPRTPMTPIGG
ncbi:MAG: GTP 3',8-cyclase MoaA [Candidatus Zipacnadales bacterium]